MEIEVSLNGLQGKAIESFNKLVDFLDNHNTNFVDNISVDVHELNDLVKVLRNDIIILAGLIDPNTNESGLKGVENVSLLSFSCLND